MTIKILPPQLANQIAAGEVVERPASVVKELVENALDAGATKVEIDIERGGHKKILIKDNGKGIPKEQLALALSRHATSKISEMDDLEAIVSLGFRGEALASISSVSRLTMTSKPESQDAAWSAIAEGLDMKVDVKPAAHPNGTSVEVLDLFFNTPARRKFLRAEKTEFSHIETLIRRIAMSRPDVTFVLQHNSKVVKRFRAQATNKSVIEQQTGRIAEVINQQFVDSASIRQSSYDNVSVTVWAKSPELCKSVNPAQYAFVNGRMMRDKLIQHAIRQAYADSLTHEQQPEYVLFVDLPATDVDVNVHPAKHEVRFHHARLLHDLIVGSIQECLSDFYQQQQIAVTDSQTSDTQEPDWVVPSSHFDNSHTGINKEPLQPATSFPGLKPMVEDSPRTPYSTPVDSNISSSGLNDNSNTLNSSQESLFEVKTVEDNFALIYFQDKYWIVAIDKLLAATSSCNIDSNPSNNLEKSQSQSPGSLDLSASPLLVPIRIRLNDLEKSHIEQHLDVYKKCGFDVKLHQHFLIVKQVPSFIRSKHSGTFLPEFFSLALVSHQPSKTSLIDLLQNPHNKPIQNTQIQQHLHILVKESDFDINWQSIAKPLRLANAFNH